MEIPSCRVAIADLTAFCREALVRCGLSDADAGTVAHALAATDSFGVFTHGSKLLAPYLRRIRAGGIVATARPAIARQGPGWAIVDGGSAMGHVVAWLAMETAIDKARACGVAYVGVRQANHFGAAGHYALRAARAGLIGLAMSNDIPSVAAPGSRRAVTGTNPLAYAVPAGRHDPIFFDVAMSTAAGGRVYRARQLGLPIAADWLIGPDGRPTLDAALYPRQAALAPMAGHKGYGLALLIETLSAVLSGAAVTWQVGDWMWDDLTRPTGHGAAFLAIDVATIAPPAEFAARVEALVDEIHAAPTADGVERVQLPGEREWAQHRRALAEGILLPPDVVERVREAAALVALAPDWLSPDVAANH